MERLDKFGRYVIGILVVILFLIAYPFLPDSFYDKDDSRRIGKRMRQREFKKIRRASFAYYILVIVSDGKIGSCSDRFPRRLRRWIWMKAMTTVKENYPPLLLCVPYYTAGYQEFNINEKVKSVEIPAVEEKQPEPRDWFVAEDDSVLAFRGKGYFGYMKKTRGMTFMWHLFLVIDGGKSYHFRWHGGNSIQEWNVNKMKEGGAYVENYDVSEPVDMTLWEPGNMVDFD